MKQFAYLLGAALIIATLLFFVFSNEEDAVRNYPSAGTDILAFGDSLVQGVGAIDGNDFVSLLSKKIDRPIVNLGVSGDTTAQGLARIGELDRYHPKVVLLLLGGNDHLRKVPIQETFANLGAIIENIQQRGAIVLLLGIRGSLLGDQFEAEFEKLHEQHKSAYVSDVLSGIFGHGELMSDSIHPNNLGYAKIAERIYPVLLPLLQ
ncbi:MAG: arylesterase [bacterium]|nr:arylesterase [bacterium]